MALWNSNNVVVTQKGYELLSKLQNGSSTMTITRVVTGSGRVSPSLLYKQTAVSSIKQDMQVLKKVASEKGSTLELQVSNENLVEGYNLNQIGVYASNPDLGEILYMIAQSDEPSDFIPTPSGTPTILNYSLEVVHSKLASINVSVSNTGLQPSYDPTLKTTSKIVTEAINEIWDKSNKFFRLFSELPLVGNNDTIYIVYGDVDSKNGQYRWDGTKYDSIASKAQQITSFTYSFTSTTGGESVIPFDIIGYESNQVLIVDLDGVVLKKDLNYTLGANSITLKGFTLERGETLNFLNLRNISIENLPELMDLFNLHINNKNNPHQVTAEQVKMPDGTTSVSLAIGQRVNKAGDEMTGELNVPGILVKDSYRIKTLYKPMLTPTGQNEVEIDLGDGYFFGTLRITVASGFSGGNASGSITKSIDFIGTTSIVTQIGKYIYVGENTKNCLMISNIYINAGRKKIKIVQTAQSRNTVAVTLEGYGLFFGLENATISEPVVSTETFVSPKGSMIHSSGSNANGEWIRFEDGTQICTVRVSLAETIGIGAKKVGSWNYPASFIDTPSVSGEINLIRDGNILKSSFKFVGNTVSLTSLRYVVFNDGYDEWGTSGQIASSSVFTGITIGRWK